MKKCRQCGSPLETHEPDGFWCQLYRRDGVPTHSSSPEAWTRWHAHVGDVEVQEIAETDRVWNLAIERGAASLADRCGALNCSNAGHAAARAAHKSVLALRRGTGCEARS